MEGEKDHINLISFSKADINREYCHRTRGARIVMVVKL